MTKPHITVSKSLITKPLLAARVEDNSLDTLKFPVGVTDKIDGIRCLKIEGQAVSRTFKPIPNHHIRKLIEEHLPDGMDMEITMPEYPKGSFQDCTGNVMREDSVNDFKVWIIDYVTGSLDEPYEERIEKAHDWFKDHAKGIPFKWQVLLPVVIKDKETLEKNEAAALSRGFEGIMVRDLGGRYKCGRSTFNDGILIKIKRFEDSEAVVRTVEELYHNGNEALKDAFGRTKRSTAQENLTAGGTLGALIVEGVGGDYDKISFRVGTGFTQAQRDDLWGRRTKIIGKIVKVKYFPTGVKDAPRFPTFIGFRDPRDMGE
jgi:DNA ligase-1